MILLNVRICQLNSIFGTGKRPCFFLLTNLAIDASEEARSWHHHVAIIIECSLLCHIIYEKSVCLIGPEVLPYLRVRFPKESLEKVLKKYIMIARQ
jgi:hypothetical protein